MVTTVFDKTQVWRRKSILSVKSYPDLAPNHLKLIRDTIVTIATIANSDPYETILEGNQKNVEKVRKSIL